MTTQALGNSRPGFNSGEEYEEELELTPVQKIRDVANQVAWHIRRPIVFAPIFGVVFVVLGFLWFQEAQVEHAVHVESDSLRTLLLQPEPQPELLRAQADGWDTAYNVALDDRTARPADSDLIGRVIEAAETSGLVVIETGTTDDGIAKLANDSYTSTPLLIKANGTLAGIERFLELLETEDFAAFEIQGSLMNAEFVGYILTLRGVFYSLPENFGDQLADEDGEIQAFPVVEIESPEHAH